MGEAVPEENFWTLWCKGRLTQSDTLTIRLGATLSGLTSANLHHLPVCCNSNAIRAAIANSPNSAQLKGIPYHSLKLHHGPYNSVGMRPWKVRQKHTDTQMRMTTIHFASSTTRAKCNYRHAEKLGASDVRPRTLR